MFRFFVSFVIVALLLTGCGAATEPTTEAPAPIIPVLAASELTTGVNRLPFGLLQAGAPLNDPNMSLQVRLFRLDASRDTPQTETTAIYRGEGLPVGLYVAYAEFDQPGAWEAELSVPSAQGEAQVSRMRLDVLPQPRAPGVGTQAVPSQNDTAADVPELNQLTSDPRPDPDLYQLSVAEALTAGKPFLVSFATPGYCQTAVCAPNLAVIKQLKEQYQEQVNFLHVEVYPYPFGESFQQMRRVPAMQEWNLLTEPWTFLVDAEGTIVARYEGGITLSELEPALASLAAGEAIDFVP